MCPFKECEYLSTIFLKCTEPVLMRDDCNVKVNKKNDFNNNIMHNTIFFNNLTVVYTLVRNNKENSFTVFIRLRLCSRISLYKRLYS